MSKRRKPVDAAAAHEVDAAALAPVVNAGFQAVTARVQEMHQAIAGSTFDHLLRVPGLSMPTRIVQGVHDAITQGVYAAVRHGGGAALSLAGQAERIAADPARVPGAREQAARSALNGVFGDRLAASASHLAFPMGWFADGKPLDLTPDALRGLRPRVGLFLHGLACDEQSWVLRSDAWRASAWDGVLKPGEPVHYGPLLAHELDLSAVYLRYNTGLSIDANAEQLAAQLAQAAAAAPHVQEWLLIGHSMGGLVARRAHALLADDDTLAARTPMIVCLGSPHQGARLEQLGRLATDALNLSAITQPLGRIANARSQGIKDLHGGLKGAPTPTRPPALRLVFGTLADEADTGVGALVGRLLGDGLVMPGSASDDGLVGDVERVELAGIGHMALLNHPRVYEVLRRWLGAPELSPTPNAAPRG